MPRQSAAQPSPLSVLPSSQASSLPRSLLPQPAGIGPTPLPAVALRLITVMSAFAPEALPGRLLDEEPETEPSPALSSPPFPVRRSPFGDEEPPPQPLQASINPIHTPAIMQNALSTSDT